MVRVYLFVYELANYNSAKRFETFSLDFCIVPHSSKVSEITNSSYLQPTEFSTRLEETEKNELPKYLKKFYLSARQKDEGYFEAKTLRSIRAILDQHLQRAGLKKSFSMITDTEFLEASKALDAFVN